MTTALLILPDRRRAARHSAPLALPRVRRRDAARRVLNIVVALAGIALTWPVMLLIALAIKLTSRGPVLYSQWRVGVDRRVPVSPAHDGRRAENIGGRPFRIWKFRTMRADGDEAQVWARRNDARITPLGRVLRKYRLDELPQLFNVLHGDMNVVGPRPEQPAIFAQLRRQVERYAQRQLVLPGITGWAQVNLGYDNSVDDVRRKVAYDLDYVMQQRSVAADARIMLRTIPVMVGRRGAQ
jgi:lipopolysaccharide/colanic/teichoic acid biosynthesis glycosyltransferase